MTPVAALSLLSALLVSSSLAFSPDPVIPLAGTSLSLLNDATPLVNDPLRFSWTLPHPATGDHVVLYHSSVADSPSINWTTASTDLSPTEWPLYWSETSGVLEVRDDTPRVGSYVAYLVSVNATDGESHPVVAARFVVSTSNSMVVLNSGDVKISALVWWSAPKYHSGYDSINAVRADCRTESDEECLAGSVMLGNAARDQESADKDTGTAEFWLGSEVGRVFYFEYSVHGRDVLMKSENVAVRGVAGQCGMDCAQPRAACADSAPCGDCTEASYCVFPERPQLMTADGSPGMSVTLLSGDAGFEAKMVLVTPTSNVSEVMLFTDRSTPLSYSLGTPRVYGNRTAGLGNTYATEVNVTWRPRLVTEVAYTTFCLKAYDGISGQVSSCFDFTVYVNDQYCQIWGDPHFITLDGSLFDYQGTGDFVMVEGGPHGSVAPTGSEPVCQWDLFPEVQERFSPCWDDSATCVRAVAVGLMGGKRLSIQPNGTVMANEDLEYTRFVALLDGRPLPDNAPTNLTCREPSTNTSVVYGTVTHQDSSCWDIDLRKRGLALRVNFCYESFTASVYLGSRWINHTRGMCGTFNQDVEDDLTPRTGPILFNYSQSTNQKIFFNYSESWRVAESESLFDYTTYPNTSYYQVNVFNATPNFEPDFPDEKARADAHRMCGHMAEWFDESSEHVRNACLFDAAFGGSDLAWLALTASMDRCMQEQNIARCVIPTDCGLACYLNGQCVQNDETSAWSCQCDEGFLPPHCELPANRSSSSSSSSSPGRNDSSKRSSTKDSASNHKVDAAADLAVPLSVLISSLFLL